MSDEIVFNEGEGAELVNEFRHTLNNYIVSIVKRDK
jgi:hypothetical protein